MGNKEQDKDQAGPDRSAASLVDQARAGDKRAFEQLVDQFQERIFRMAYYRTQSQMDAEDLTQETFFLAFRNLPKLQKPEQFRPWLFSIALNKVRDFHRKKRLASIFGVWSEADTQECSGDAGHHQPEAVNSLMRQEFWKQVESFLVGLSRMEREVFVLRFMDNLTIREIVRVIGRSESAVKTHLYRGIRKFKEDPAILQTLSQELS